MQYDFNLAANGAQFVDVAGRFFKYKSGLGPIRVRISTGGYVDVLPGQGVFGVDFSSLSIIDISGAANRGVVLAGEYDFRDDTIAGTVNVVDGGKTRSMSNSSFLGYVNTAAVAAQYGHAQLWNPNGSGKNIYVSRIYFSSSTPTPNAPRIVSYNTALATFAGNAVSKKMGGASSVAEMRYGSNAAQLGAFMFTCYLSPYVLSSVDLKEPIVLTPGSGICTVAGTYNTDFPTTFDFCEEPI